MKKSDGLMMIEPREKASPQPVVDKATRKMTAAWRLAKHSNYAYRGFHRCNCGVFSDNKDHWVGDRLTNSLAIHYLAYHRKEVPKSELEKVMALSCGEETPTDKELKKPSR